MKTKFSISENPIEVGWLLTILQPELQLDITCEMVFATNLQFNDDSGGFTIFLSCCYVNFIYQNCVFDLYGEPCSFNEFAAEFSRINNLYNR